MRLLILLTFTATLVYSSAGASSWWGKDLYDIFMEQCAEDWGRNYGNKVCKCVQYKLEEKWPSAKKFTNILLKKNDLYARQLKPYIRECKKDSKIPEWWRFSGYSTKKNNPGKCKNVDYSPKLIKNISAGCTDFRFHNFELDVTVVNCKKSKLKTVFLFAPTKLNCQKLKHNIRGIIAAMNGGESSKAEKGRQSDNRVFQTFEECSRKKNVCKNYCYKLPRKLPKNFRNPQRNCLEKCNAIYCAESNSKVIACENEQKICEAHCEGLLDGAHSVFGNPWRDCRYGGKCATVCN